MRYYHVQIGLVVLMFGVIVEKAPAGLILQNQSTGTAQILLVSPVGQTFTAEEAQIQSFAFFLSDSNSTLPNGITTVKLYEGIGTAGSLLDSANLVIAPGTQGFVDFDFSSVILTVGNVYTSIIERPNARWGIERNQHTYPTGTPISGRVDYPGGDYIVQGSVQAILDARFRVIPIPEPTTGILFTVCGLTLARCRHDRLSQF